MTAILKPTDLKSDVGGVLDRVIQGEPQFVIRGGHLLVIRMADRVDAEAAKEWAVDWNDFFDRPRQHSVRPDAADEIRKASRR